ncbi:MFS general substrate transporter [Schizophyllum commune Loenen D]|nr:MFS general substrate transporter [Schizophyllum commune Loenen D]
MASSDEKKVEWQPEHIEQYDRRNESRANIQNAAVDEALKTFGDERIEVTEEDNKRILRRTDVHVLTILSWVYWLQILDKSILGYSATFGLKTDAHLTGSQYSVVGSLSAVAQLCWMPVSSYLIVLVFCWGAACCGMGASHTYPALAATRFLLGLFEAACLPLFAVLTSIWYRRAEQPLRVCVWYGTNGMGTIMGAIFAYGFGHVHSDTLYTYQMIFIFCGLLTVLTAPVVYWKIDNSVSDARFLTPEDRHKAVERLRANNTGTAANNEFKWGQVFEALLEPKSWLFFCMTLCVNVGASVVNVFGPLILGGIGFDKYRTTLLNLPLGAIQIIVIVFSSYAAYQWRYKGPVLVGLSLVVLLGLILLYVIEESNTGVRLFAYYLLAFLFGINPLIVSWIAANTAGSTKKSVVLAMFNMAVGAGNIIGPYLFTESDAPSYHKGFKACMGIFAALVALTIAQIFNMIALNKLKARERVKNGKPANIRDLSMEKKYTAHVEEVKDDSKLEASTTGAALGDNAFLDLTDKQNDELCEEQVRDSSPKRHSISHGDTPGLEAFLWFFWSQLLQAVEHSDSDAFHTRVLDVMASLKAHESPKDCLFAPNVRECLNGPTVFVAGKHLPTAEWTPEERELLTAAEAPQTADERAQAFVTTGRRYVSLHKFLARAWATDLYNGTTHALWAMRDAFEYEPGSEHYHKLPRALAVEAAAPWAAHDAKRMFKCREILGPKGRKDWEESLGAPGRGGEKWNGVDGYDVARWKLWKEGFEEFLREERSQKLQHVRRAVEAALIAMDNAERES